MTKEKQSTLQKIIKSRFFVIILIIILVVVASSYIRAFYRDYKVKQEIEELKGEVNKLKKKKIESMELLEYVTSEDFVENKARTELNMKKPGEKAMVIKDNQTSSSTDKIDKKEERQINPIKWWNYFTHNNN